MILSADKENRIDGTVMKIVQMIDCEVDLMPITRIGGFKFNDKLPKEKTWVMIDFCEYGANDWDRKDTHIFGGNTDNFKYAFPGKEWDKFDEWVSENPPILTLKRELLKKDVSGILLPIEYPCFGPSYPIQDKQSFINRPIELFHYWGWSHESRRIFHGRVWEHAAKTGKYVVDNINHLAGALKDTDNKHLWVTANIPHFARIDMNIIYSVAYNSLLSLSLPGAGIKCFRHTEVPLASVMVLQDDPLAWSKEWISGFNCIRVPIGDSMEDIMGTNGKCPEIPIIEEALRRTDLHKIYLEGLNTCDWYRPENYIKKYVEQKINESLRNS